MLDRLFAIHFCSPALDGPAHDLPPADRHPCTIGLPPFAYSMWFGTRHGIPLRHDSLGAHPVETSGLSSATQRRPNPEQRNLQQQTIDLYKPCVM